MSAGRHPRIGIPWASREDPSFRGAGTYTSSGGTAISTISTTLANISSGDLLIVFAARSDWTDGDPTCSGGGLTWVTAKSINVDPAGSNYGYGAYAAKATSNQASLVVTINFSTSSPYGLIASCAYNAPYLIATSSVVSSNTTLSAAATTRTSAQVTTSARSLLVGMAANWDNEDAFAAANGYTLRIPASGNTAVMIADKVADAGNYGGAANFGTSLNEQYFPMLLSFNV